MKLNVKEMQVNLAELKYLTSLNRPIPWNLIKNLICNCATILSTICNSLNQPNLKIRNEEENLTKISDDEGRSQ